MSFSQQGLLPSNFGQHNITGIATIPPFVSLFFLQSFLFLLYLFCFPLPFFSFHLFLSVYLSSPRIRGTGQPFERAESKRELNADTLGRKETEQRLEEGRQCLSILETVQTAHTAIRTDALHTGRIQIDVYTHLRRCSLLNFQH